MNVSRKIRTNARHGLLLATAIGLAGAWSGQALAGDATLASNEVAARAAIVDAGNTRTFAVRRHEEAPSLDRAQRSARAAIDASGPALATPRQIAIGAATLSSNERAARRAIFEAAAPSLAGAAAIETVRVAAATR